LDNCSAANPVASVAFFGHAVPGAAPRHFRGAGGASSVFPPTASEPSESHSPRPAAVNSRPFATPWAYGYGFRAPLARLRGRGMTKSRIVSGTFPVPNGVGGFDLGHRVRGKASNQYAPHGDRLCIRNGPASASAAPRISPGTWTTGEGVCAGGSPYAGCPALRPRRGVFATMPRTHAFPRRPELALQEAADPSPHQSNRRISPPWPPIASAWRNSRVIPQS